MNIPITKAVLGEEERLAIQKPLETGWLVQGPFVTEFEALFSDYTASRYTKAVSNCTTALHLALDALGIGPGDKVVVPSFTYVASANAVTYTGAEVIFCDINLDTFNLDMDCLAKILARESNIKAVMPVHLFGLCADMPSLMRCINVASVSVQDSVRVSDTCEYNEVHTHTVSTHSQSVAHTHAVPSHNHGIAVIEDAACAFGSYIENQHAGTFGDAGCFSFHPRKSITTGEGGMITTESESLFSIIKQLCDHGAGKSDLERHNDKGGSLLPDFNMRGYNYRMTDMQGALGVCQMKKANNILAGRANIAKMYDEALGSVSIQDSVGVSVGVSKKLSHFLKAPVVPEGYTHGYQSYVCLFTAGEDISDLTVEKIDRINLKRNQFMERLEARGIATRQGTHAVHTLSYYKKRYNLKDANFINSYAADRLSIALPLYAQMTTEEFSYVIDGIAECLAFVV